MMEERNITEVDVGTIHPALIEPFRTRFFVEDETIVDCEITYNAAHRGIERILEGLPVKKAHMVTEKICGLCSTTHLWNSVRATEKAMGIEVPERAQYIRVMVNELDRLHSHIFFLAHGFETLGHETFTYRTFALREPLMRLLLKLTGNRVHYSTAVLGGVRPRCDPDDALIKEMEDLIDALEKQIVPFVERVTTDPMVLSRITGVGILDKKTAEKTHAVGPTARGSGINNDIRAEMEEYKDFDFDYVVLKDCDVKDRLLVRAFEIPQIFTILRQCLSEMPKGPSCITPKMRMDTGYVEVYNEAPRGELYHAFRVDSAGLVRNYRVRTPTPPNLAAMEKACIGDHLTDGILTIVSCDPCLSCSNRATIVDTGSGKESIVDFTEVKRQ